MHLGKHGFEHTACCFHHIVPPGFTPTPLNLDPSLDWGARQIAKRCRAVWRMFFTRHCLYKRSACISIPMQHATCRSRAAHVPLSHIAHMPLTRRSSLRPGSPPCPLNLGLYTTFKKADAPVPRGWRREQRKMLFKLLPAGHGGGRNLKKCSTNARKMLTEGILGAISRRRSPNLAQLARS